MLEGVNDSSKRCKTINKTNKSIKSKINLIPFNPWPNSSL